MATGAFREDLYYRLCDIALEVPPLRARREDIPRLIEHFRARFNARWGLAVEGLAPDAVAAMMFHRWPGNVRELEQVIKEAIILRGGGLLEREDLRISRSGGLPSVGADDTASGHGALQPPAPGGARADIALTIARERGSVTRAELSQACGISGETARQELATLTRLGHLRRTGRARSARYVLR
jgi:DNA-binding NtrC family response regulator